MYINDTHIGFYILFAILGLIIGQFTHWMIIRLPENKRVFSRDIIRAYKFQFKPNYILMIITSVIYVSLVYNLGINHNFIENLNLIKYLLLVPMLLAVFVIDYKQKIIPNRLNLTMFEIGIVIAFIYGFSNIAITLELLFGMLIGGGIFLIISAISGLIYGKEAMGFGDIKFMIALGLYFGFVNTIVISIMAFIFGAIISIILIICRAKKSNEYIPFGPFIVISTLVCMFLPTDFIINTLKTALTLGMF